MKAKLKSPDIAKANGLEFNKKQLKKLLKEPFAEPLRFFYDSEFSYTEAAEPQPFFYVGDIPALWKKYIKERKKEKTFAAGLCMLTDKGELKLEVQAGKGGKAAVLKAINKSLLRPFSKAFFVDSISSDAEIEETNEIEDADAADSFSAIDITDLIEEAQELIKEANTAYNALETAVKEVAAPLKDLKNTVVTDKLIKDTAFAMGAIQASTANDLLQTANAWLQELDEDTVNSNDGLKKAVADLKTIVTKLNGLDSDIKSIEKNAGKVQKVENPMESETPPISDDPLDNFGAVLLSFGKKSKLPKHVEDLKAYS